MNNTRPIALLLTPVLPLPGDSGRALRAWDWLRELAGSYRVHVLVVGDDLPALPTDYPAEGVWPVAAASVASSRAGRALGLLFPPLGLLSRRYLSDWIHPIEDPVLDSLAARLTGTPVARMVVFRLYLHDVALTTAGRFQIAALELDMDDLESRTRLSVAGSLFRMRRPHLAALWMATALQYWLVERFTAGPYRIAWLASTEDCRHLRTRLATSVAGRANRLPNPAEPGPPPKGMVRLLFVGTLDYPPNEEAVRNLVEQVVPELTLRLSMPWRLYILGRHASLELIAQLAKAPQVELVADADDVAPWYAVSHVVVVPLRAGGGTKFKSLEGLAHRRALVSTRHGMRGLGAVPGEHYLNAETPSEFAAAIARLAGDPALAKRLAEAGWMLSHKAHGAA